MGLTLLILAQLAIYVGHLAPEPPDELARDKPLLVDQDRELAQQLIALVQK